MDFDWFSVDGAGEIGHFATAGFKRLPVSVSLSAEDLTTVTQFFQTELGVIGGYEVDTGLTVEIPEPQNRTERYLRSFVKMAERGLYSYDIASYLKPHINYFRVASPEKPLKFDDLPEFVRKIVGRTVLKGRRFGAASKISYEETLAM